MGTGDYTKARRAAEKMYREDVAAGKYPFVPALDEMVRERNRLREERVGTMEIPLSLVKGTVTKGRQEAFARNFMPLLSDDSEFALKWSGLLSYQEDEGIMDPIKVYEFLGRFYVLEGNKRVSVLKYLGSPGIPAEVIRIMPPEGMAEESEEVRAYREFLLFYQYTGLYEPMLSQAGSYERLAEIYGQSLEKKWHWRTVQSLRSAFFRFCREFRGQGGDELQVSAGDAFMLFLDIYGRKPLQGGREAELRKKMKQLWAEYRVRSNREPMAFMRLPNVRRPRTPLRRMLYKAARHAPVRPLKIAFIYDGDPGSSRWLGGHERGRISMEKRMRGRVRTRAFPKCDSPELFEAAVAKAVSDGAGVIVTVSPVQMTDTLRAAVRNPGVRFLNCSVHLSHSAVRTYYGRMYEVKFLLGALAAALADGHRIGYVSGAPFYGTVANINAFAIGASMVDPKAEISLTWSCLEGRNWRQTLHDEGLTIVSGPDLIHPGKEDREYGLYRYEADGSVTTLASPVWKWGRFYELMARSAMARVWKQEADAARDQALNYWWGLSSDVIGIDLSEAVPASSAHLIEGLRKALVAGILGPFEGPLQAQGGLVEDAASQGSRGGRSPLRHVLSAGEKLISMNFFEENTEADLGLPPEEIVTMDWLHENVKGRIPDWDELTPSARKAVSAGGILSAVKK